MTQVTISLYSFSELNEAAKEKAIIQHAGFMALLPELVENEAGEMDEDYVDYSRDDVIENIQINEYLFFHDGSLANCTTYTGTHPKSGQTEFHFYGQTFNIS